MNSPGGSAVLISCLGSFIRWLHVEDRLYKKLMGLP